VDREQIEPTIDQGHDGLRVIRPRLPDAVYCIGCAYDLAGNDGRVCPECGRDFDPFDGATWHKVPRDRQLATKAKRIGLAVLIAGLIVMGMYHSVLPRPLSKNQPLVWVWLGMSFGREMQVSRSGDQMRILWFANECKGIDLIGINDGGDGSSPSRNRLASLRRGKAPDAWRLRVHGKGVRVDDILTAVNYFTLDHEYLGIQFPRGVMREETDGPFEAEGTRDELLSALLREFDAKPVRSFLLDQAQGMVWVWSDAEDALVRVEVDEAIEADKDVRVDFIPRFPDSRSPSERLGW
jgi:hypothetical protein